MSDIICELCGVADGTVKDCRDPEEGHNGPTYMWCDNCRSKNDESFCRSMDGDYIDPNYWD